MLSSDGGPGVLLGEFSYWRTVYAGWAWQEGCFRRIVLSGDAAGCQPMRAYLRFSGVPEAALTLETASGSTRDNAVHTSALLAGEPGVKVLLTSDYHMFRAIRAFRKAGLTALPRPVPDAGKRAQRLTARPGVFFDLALETVKIGYYAARGWL